MSEYTDDEMKVMLKAWRPPDAPAEAKSELAPARGSARPKTFVAEKSDTKFALTPQEEAHLNNLLAWQEQSAKSVMMIGGTGEAPNAVAERLPDNAAPSAKKGKTE